MANYQASKTARTSQRRTKLLCLVAPLLTFAIVNDNGAAAAAAPRRFSTNQEALRRGNRLLPHDLDDNVFRRKGGSGLPKSLKNSKSMSLPLKLRGTDIKGKKSKSDPKGRNIDPLNTPSIEILTDITIISSDEGPTLNLVNPVLMEDLLNDVSVRQAEVEGCQLNANGLYGDAATAGDVYTVQYLYQTSVVAGTSTSQLNDIVIPALDRAITTAVLPTFFDCSGSNRRRRRLQEGTVVAISAIPVDTFVLSGCKYNNNNKHVGISWIRCCSR
jgi:hypothetical protein